MSTLDIDGGRREMGKTGFVYLLLTLLCVVFGAVYEVFSHQVYSYYMLYAFAIPLVCGVLPFFALAFSTWPVPGRWARKVYHSGIAALTVGCFFTGVLEIYGTTNSLVRVYFVTGAALCALGLLIYGLGAWHRAGRDAS